MYTMTGNSHLDLCKTRSKDRVLAISIAVILTVVVRVTISLLYKTYEFGPDRDFWAFGHEWGRIAKWLAQTGMFSLDGKVPTADTDPLYIWVIALFFHVFGVFTTSAGLALVVFQSLLCGLTTWAIFVLAERVYGSVEARLSALLFAFYPASVFFAVSRIGPSSLAVLLLCLVFLAASRLPGSPGLISSLSIGVLIGMVALTSSDNLSLFLVIPLWLFLVATGQRGRMILKSSIIIMAAVVVLLPWSLRNSSVSGETTVSKANLGYHLYVGNNPHATGFFYTSQPPELSDGVSPYKQSEYYAMAVSWITQHPGEFLKLTLTRIQYFWFVIEGRAQSRSVLLQGSLLLIMMAFAVTGLFRRSQNFQSASLLWLFVAIYPLVFYFTHASFYRHRYHIEPFVLILASHGFHGIWTLFTVYKRKNEGAQGGARGRFR